MNLVVEIALPHPLARAGEDALAGRFVAEMQADDRAGCSGRIRRKTSGPSRAILIVDVDDRPDLYPSVILETSDHLLHPSSLPLRGSGSVGGAPT